MSLPEGLFLLPALQHLDVSNNKLVALPFKMWSAPKLRELNASFNLLQSLPVRPEDISHEYGELDSVLLRKFALDIFRQGIKKHVWGNCNFPHEFYAKID